jgi:hypothetical protein
MRAQRSTLSTRLDRPSGLPQTPLAQSLATPAPSNRPFRDNAEGRHHLVQCIDRRHTNTHFADMHPFTSIVHRRALLDHIPAAHRA